MPVFDPDGIMAAARSVPPPPSVPETLVDATPLPTMGFSEALAGLDRAERNARRREASSSVREARQLIDANAAAAVRAAQELAGLGDPEQASKDDATRARLLMDQMDRAGLRAPTVTEAHVYISTQQEAYDHLHQILASRGAIDVESLELD